MQDKRGVSAFQRDERYTLKGVVELDGASFERVAGRGEAKTLIAVESKDWIDANGQPKSKAGFAKVVVSRETKIRAQEFVDTALERGTWVNSDASPAFAGINGIDLDQQVMGAMSNVLDRWLP